MTVVKRNMSKKKNRSQKKLGQKKNESMKITMCEK